MRAEPHEREPLDAATVQELLRLTREMVSAACAEDWDAVSRRNAERTALMDVAREDEPFEEPSDALVAALREANRSVLEHARRSRDKLVENTHQVRAERGARHNYARIMAGIIDDGRQ